MITFSLTLVETQNKHVRKNIFINCTHTLALHIISIKYEY